MIVDYNYKKESSAGVREMIRKSISVIVGGFFIFLITNIFFPAIFQDTIFAGVSQKLNPALDNYNNYHFLIDTSSKINEPTVMNHLRSKLANKVFAYDVSGNIISGQEISKAKTSLRLRSDPVKFVAYDPAQLKPGNRVVQSTIFPRDLDDNFPVKFAFFEVNQHRQLVSISRPAFLQVSAAETAEETSNRTANLILLASLF